MKANLTLSSALLSVLFGALALVSTAQAADLAAGKKIAEAQCAACHAKANGAEKDWAQSASPDMPVLAGQRRDYLVHSLKAYQNGGRKNAIMGGENGQAAKLTKADIENLAAFFASQKGPMVYK
jgi:cytochrome c553